MWAQINALARVCEILEALQLLWVTVRVSPLAVSTQRSDYAISSERNQNMFPRNMLFWHKKSFEPKSN